MSNLTILLVVAVVILLAVIGWLFMERQRTLRLRDRFGPEYDRAVTDAGSRRKAEADLAERERRVANLQIRPLDPVARDRFAAAWRETQAHFVDDPAGAIGDADSLIGQVMEARGYPVADFERRAADISVDHGDVVDHYRAGHAIAQRANDGNSADTEALRQAMVHYRALFASLLGEPSGSAAAAGTASPGAGPSAAPVGGAGFVSSPRNDPVTNRRAS